MSEPTMDDYRLASLCVPAALIFAEFDEHIDHARKEAAKHIAKARCARHTFPLGTRVTKIKGSSWTGRVVGHYSSSLTAEGVVVESEREPGSCQLYPNSAMRAMGDDE